jgi:hypothetical protein
MRIVAYVKARLAERSTWAGVIGGFTGASALSEPWSYAAGVAGAIMALMPEQPKKDESQ